MPKDDKPSEKALNPELEQLQDLYNLMLEKGLDAVEMKDEDSRVKLTRRFANPPAGSYLMQSGSQRRSTDGAVAPGPVPEPQTPVSNAQIIPTPLAGVFYRASAPTSAPFVKEGDVVESGQTLCIVEAMKVMNEIKAEARCRIAKIVAENGRPVTAGQALFQTEPA